MGTMWKRNATINQRNFDGMIMLIDSNHAMVHELNEVSSRIWTLCDGSHDADRIAQMLSEEFDVSFQEAQGDVHQFGQRLLQMGLLESSEGCY